jgi:hypothetical protein
MTVVSFFLSILLLLALGCLIIAVKLFNDKKIHSPFEIAKLAQQGNRLAKLYLAFYAIACLFLIILLTALVFKGD